ncbi:hypothetical protein ACFJIV_05295 [Mucilaginibacter sp. UC70_90]
MRWKVNVIKKIFADYLDGKQAFVIHKEVHSVISTKILPLV